MLDQQHRHVLDVAHAPDLPAQHVDLVVVEARGRLVEQQQLGAAGERAGELDALAHREGQPPGGQARMGLEVHERDQLLGALGDAALLGLRLRQAQRVGEEARRGAAVAADLDVVEHRHAVEQRHVLEGAADADARDGMARLAEDGAALEQDVAVVGHVEARQAVEERGLARAVGADQAGDLAGRHVEGDAVQRHDAAEADRYGAHAQQRFGAAGGGGAQSRLRYHDGRNAPLVAMFAFVGWPAPPLSDCRTDNPTLLKPSATV